LVSILRVREVRNKSFNCYILAVVFPDFQFSLSCSITCAMNAVQKRYMGEAMCGWQTWYGEHYMIVISHRWFLHFTMHLTSELFLVYHSHIWICRLMLDECGDFSSIVHHVEDVTFWGKVLCSVDSACHEADVGCVYLRSMSSKCLHLERLGDTI
jgi:hypothetical protein